MALAQAPMAVPSISAVKTTKVQQPNSLSNIMASLQQPVDSAMKPTNTGVSASVPSVVDASQAISPVDGILQGQQDQTANQNAMLQAAALARLQSQQPQNPSATGSSNTLSQQYNYNVPNVGDSITPEQFAMNLLKGLGVARTPSDISAMERWEAQEGGNWHNDASYNPLNTTQSMPGYHEVGTQGNIGAYRNWDQGLEATLKTLENGRYGGIINALRQGNSVQAILNAISNSPWGTHF